jgi:hypothetical protein
MNPEDISKFVHGCDTNNLNDEEYCGHIGILMMHLFLNRGSLDVDRFIKEYKMPKDMAYEVFDRLNANGMFHSYSWPVKSRNALMSILRHKDKEITKDWCQIAAISAGFMGKI